MKAFSFGKKISVHAIAGTNVVFLGLDATETGRKGLLGFGIARTDNKTEKTIWLKGYQHFENNHSAETSDKVPIQLFQWSDYTAQPGHGYTYKVIPFYGKPPRLSMQDAVTVQVTTEDEEHETHAVFFNRGVAGSQSYSSQFGDYRRYYLENGVAWKKYIKPEDVPDNKAWKWLSRGLEEALINFILQAKGSEYSLRASLYELTYIPVLEAFATALESGADVKIVHHSKDVSTTILKRGGKQVKSTSPDDVGLAANQAIYSIGIADHDKTQNWKSAFIRRTKAQISHNKFIVLLKKGKPIQVWTGSTNITSGGIFGQSNVGHIVRDPNVAAEYYQYWRELSNDPDKSGLADWNESNQKDIEGKAKDNSITAIFSPRPSDEMLKWYANQLGNATDSVHFTAAFGVSQEIGKKLVGKNGKTSVLRQILLESTRTPGVSNSKKSKGKNVKSSAKKAPVKAKKKPLVYEDYVKVPNNQIAYGDLLRQDIMDDKVREFLEEDLTGLNAFVDFLHTKYMLVDPLTQNPLVISGSANFSEASTVRNDENMLVIKGNTRIADIFLTEFSRLFYHFRMRNEINSGKSIDDIVHLRSDDSWANPFFKSGTPEFKQRELFGKPKYKY